MSAHRGQWRRSPLGRTPRPASHGRLSTGPLVLAPSVTFPNQPPGAGRFTLNQPPPGGDCLNSPAHQRSKLLHPTPPINAAFSFRTASALGLSESLSTITSCLHARTRVARACMTPAVRRSPACTRGARACIPPGRQPASAREACIPTAAPPPPRTPTTMTAQNGAVFTPDTKIAVTGCPTAKASRRVTASKALTSRSARHP